MVEAKKNQTRMSYSNLVFFCPSHLAEIFFGLKGEKYPLKNSKLDCLAKIFSGIMVKNTL